MRYLVIFELLLTFTNALEGVSMSLLSKVIHPGLARGTFNAGAPLCTLCTVVRPARRCDGRVLFESSFVCLGMDTPKACGCKAQ